MQTFLTTFFDSSVINLTNLSPQVKNDKHDPYVNLSPIGKVLSNEHAEEQIPTCLTREEPRLLPLVRPP